MNYRGGVPDDGGLLAQLQQSSEGGLYLEFSLYSAASGVAISQRGLRGKVGPRRTDLAKEADAFRKLEGIRNPKRNIAVFEYRDAATQAIRTLIFVNEAPRDGYLHAERVGVRELRVAGVNLERDVLRVYSEREPCAIPTYAAGCKRMLKDEVPNAKITWGVEYGATSESRDVGDTSVAQYLRGIL